jgi:arylsulfatase A
MNLIARVGPGFYVSALMRRLLTFSFLLIGLAIRAEQPNVVLILADDMGFGDVRALNPESKIPTPGLDRLARQGATFLDAHTPSSVCTPTRYALLAGRYCWRTWLKSGVLNGYAPPLISPDRMLISGFMKSQGYHTGIVGKWHLGLGFQKKADSPPARSSDKRGKRVRYQSGNGFDFSKPLTDGPHTRGFDYSFIIPASLDFPPYVYIRNGRLTADPSMSQEAIGFPAYLRKGERSPDLTPEDSLDDLLREAVGYVKSRSKTKQPFFLYFPLTAPHKPVLPHPRFVGKTKLGPYGDFVAQVDYIVGSLVKNIDALGLKENTIVIYTSDNGSFMRRLTDTAKPDHVTDATKQEFHPGNHRANGPWRGTKADVWEAGHHVPFFVRWPARVKAGLKLPQPICLTDIFMTLADVLNAPRPKGTATDSTSVLPLLDEAATKWNRPPVIHHSSGGMFAIRQGKWKLVLGNGSGGRELPKGKPFQKPYHLFNLAADPGEQNNLIESESSLARELEKAFHEIHANEQL